MTVEAMMIVEAEVTVTAEAAARVQIQGNIKEKAKEGLHDE